MIDKLSNTLTILAALLLAANMAVPAAFPENRRGERLILATTTVIWDIARNVAGGLWEVEPLVGPGRNPHNYEPTPQDMIKAAKASVILYNGLGLDSWVERLLSGQWRGKMARVTEGLEPYMLKVPDGPYAGRNDPHLWLDASMAIKYAEKVRDVLAEVDPANAEYYRANAAAYIAKLRELDEWVREAVASIPEERRVLVTQENAFQYFARRYGFRVGGYFYSIVTEIEPTPYDTAQLVNKVRKTGVCVFFVETTLSTRAMEMMVREVGGRIAGQLYADSLGPPGSGADTYIGMMRANVEKLVAELSRWC
jgi:ABC-type Zn uptake system ZnuABC Zn-binding protein ZnuA